MKSEKEIKEQIQKAKWLKEQLKHIEFAKHQAQAQIDALEWVLEK